MNSESKKSNKDSELQKPTTRRGGRRPGAGRPRTRPPKDPRGGPRQGAGPKAGSTNAPRGRLVALVAIAKEVTPIDMIMRTAQAIWAHAVRPDGKLDIDRAKEAAAIAKDAAPYVHPKLAQVESNPEKPLTPRTAADRLDLTRRMAFAIRAEVERQERARRASGTVLEQQT